MNSVIVTGCAGFIGSHLTERLLRKDFKVTGIDCFTDYYPVEIKRNNLKGFIGNKNFTFIRRDVIDADLKGLISDSDYIFHLAAQPGVRASWGQSFEIYIKNNILGTQRLLEACMKSDIKRLVFASSSSVYGDAKEMPIKEESVTKPLSPYGVTKLAAENLCGLYHKNYGIPAVSLRYFTVYGPRQRPDMAFSKFINAVLKGSPIIIYGDGEQTRDFTYVSDIVEANILAMERGRNGEIYNIGGGSRISVNETIKIIERLAGKRARVEHKEAQSGDMRNTYADIGKARKDLGYRPETSIESGLKEMIEYVKNMLRTD